MLLARMCHTAHGVSRFCFQHYLPQELDVLLPRPRHRGHHPSHPHLPIVQFEPQRLLQESGRLPVSEQVSSHLHKQPLVIPVGSERRRVLLGRGGVACATRAPATLARQLLRLRQLSRRV